MHFAAVVAVLAAQVLVPPLPPGVPAAAPASPAPDVRPSTAPPAGAPAPAPKAPPVEAPATPADALATIESIIDEPDIADQGCSIRTQDEGDTPYGTSRDVLVSFQGVTSDDYYRPSSQQFLRVRSQRGAAIVVLNDWLDRLAFGSSTAEEARGNRIRLKLLVDLNATASLPRLKRLAERLVQDLENQKVQPSPDPGGAGVAVWRARRVRQTEDRLGDALSVIAAILRQERFEPLLRSRLEKDAEVEITKRLRAGWLRDVADRVRANGGMVPENDREWIVIDPITGYPVSAQCYGRSKAGPDTIRQILGWVDAYGAMPAGKKLDDEGMLPWPIVR